MPERLPGARSSLDSADRSVKNRRECRILLSCWFSHRPTPDSRASEREPIAARRGVSFGGLGRHSAGWLL